MKYLVMSTKSEWHQPTWKDADNVHAEGTSQAASQWAEEFHHELGHYDEDGTVWVKGPNDEVSCFRYVYKLVPQVKVHWIRSPGVP